MRQKAVGLVEIWSSKRDANGTSSGSNMRNAHAGSNNISGRGGEMRRLPPGFKEGYCPLDELIPRLEAAVSVLEKMAGPPPTTAITPPRQDRRRGRTGLRKRRLFITSMSDVLTRHYDQNVNEPYHFESLVAFARIEFPDVKNVTIRQVLEPTTREGRRQQRELNKSNGPPAEIKF